MKKHANLSIFVPHAGCTHQCSFCDQRTISHTQKVPTANEVTQFCHEYLPQNADNTEIAFFGGSFTAISENVRVPLLAAAYEFVKQGRAKGIRLSTRPDAISGAILAQLKQYGVTAIELGAQSMSDEILQLNRRGHTAAQVETAALLIKENGFSLGLQMMPGLYGAKDYFAESISTMTRLLKLVPDTMRIYPVAVLKGTELANLYINKRYIPLEIQHAVKICAELMLMCERANVNVIRVGLAADAQLEQQVVAGVYHPAFKELCQGEIFYNLFLEKLKHLPKKDYNIYVAKSCISMATGQKKCNITRLAQQGYNVKIIGVSHLINRDFDIT